METAKRPIRSRAEREAIYELHRAFWSKKYEKFIPGGRIGEWLEKRDLHRRKLSIIEQGIINGTIDVDELLAKYDLVKYL